MQPGIKHGLWSSAFLFVSALAACGGSGDDTQGVGGSSGHATGGSSGSTGGSVAGAAGSVGAGGSTAGGSGAGGGAGAAGSDAGGTVGTSGGGAMGGGALGAGGTAGSGTAGASGAAGAAGSDAGPGQTPVLRISLRVHRGGSTLSDTTLLAVLGEMNQIWLSQAGICFEINIVTHDQTQSTGFDIWFVPSVPDPPGVNGVYKGDHDIWSRDNPSLSSAPNPVRNPAARTSAHELGHGLTLDHYNGFSDSANSLMSSGTRGFMLHDFEIQAARQRANQKALADRAPLNCGPPTAG